MWAKRIGGLLFGSFVLGTFALMAWIIVDREARRDAERQERQDARAVCNRWADKLDAQTTETGVYVRWQGEELAEADPWGHNLRVHYSQGGVAEALTVRSLGPDGESHTGDDVVAVRMAANFKGVGAGIKKHAEETSANAARGAVRGAVSEVKDQVRGLLGKKKE